MQSLVLVSLGLLLGLIQLGYRPFLLGPVGLLVLGAGSLSSNKYRRLGVAGALIVSLCFVIGAAIAVWYSRPLY
jgi:hypothetical protein